MMARYGIKGFIEVQGQTKLAIKDIDTIGRIGRSGYFYFKIHKGAWGPPDNVYAEC